MGSDDARILAAAYTVALNYRVYLLSQDVFDVAMTTGEAELNGVIFDEAKAVELIVQGRRVLDSVMSDLLDLFPQVNREVPERVRAHVGAIVSMFGNRDKAKGGPRG